MKRVLSKLKPTRRKSFGAAAAICFCEALLYSANYFALLSDLEDKALAYGQSHATFVRGRLEAEVARIQATVDALAAELSSGKLTRFELPDRLRTELRGAPQLNGLGVGFDPGVVNAEFAPGFFRTENSKIRREEAGDFYDYTDPELPQARWFTDVVKSASPLWTEPHFSRAKGIMVSQYAAPVFSPGSGEGSKRLIGVVFAQLSMDHLTKFTRELNLGEEGYNFVVSAEGKFIAHPDHLFLGKDYQKKGNELDEEESLVENASKPLLGRSLYFKKGDTDRSIPAWLFYEPIGRTGWSVATVVYHGIFAPSASGRLRAVIAIVLGLVLSALFTVLFFVSREVRSARSLWQSSAAITAIFVAGIAAVWSAHRNFPVLHPPEEIIVAGESKLRRFESELDASFRDRRIRQPLKILYKTMVRRSIGVRRYSS